MAADLSKGVIPVRGTAMSTGDGVTGPGWIQMVRRFGSVHAAHLNVWISFSNLD